jgi:hypothetical protein
MIRTLYGLGHSCKRRLFDTLKGPELILDAAGWDMIDGFFNPVPIPVNLLNFSSPIY